MELSFIVNRQALVREDKFRVVANSKNYVIAQFKFSDDWIGKAKTVIFQRDEMQFPILLDETNNCRVPNELLKNSGGFRVSVVGVGDGSIITTNVLPVQVHGGSGVRELSEEELTPTLFEQIMNKLLTIQAGAIDADQVARSIEEYLSIHPIENIDATEVHRIIADYIQAHKDELRGRQGLSGKDGLDGRTPLKGVDYWTTEDLAEFSQEISDLVSDYFAEHKSELKGADGQTPQKGVDYFTQTEIDGLTQQLSQYINTYFAEHKSELTGEDGYSPIRGTDYMTSEDVAQINNMIVETVTEYVEEHKSEFGGETDAPSLLTDDLVASVSVGGVEVGTSYSAGTSLETIVRELLNPVLVPTFTAPSATLSATGAKLLESGATLQTTMSIAFNRGSISPAYGTDGYRAGSATGYKLNSSSQQSSNSFSVTVSESQKTYQGTVNYGKGTQPKNSAGANYDSPLAAGSVKTNTITYEFVDALYANTANIATVAKLALVSKSSKSKQFDFPAQTISNPEEFHVPASWNVTAVQVLNTLSGKWEDCATEFTVTDVTHKDAANRTVNYKKYTDNRGYNAGSRSIKITWN